MAQIHNDLLLVIKVVSHKWTHLKQAKNTFHIHYGVGGWSSSASSNIAGVGGYFIKDATNDCNNCITIALF